MRLYYFPNACSIAPHIALRELGLPFDLVRVDLARKETEQGVDFLGINPRGQVPVLELASGYRLTEVAVILQCIADQKPSDLLPGGHPGFVVKELLSFMSGELHRGGFAPLFRPNTPADYIEIARDNTRRCLDHLAKKLSGQTYLAGDKFTLADALIFPMLRWAPRKDLPLSNWPNLARLLDRIDARPSVIDAKRAEGIA